MEDFRLMVSPILKKYSFSCIRCGDCCRERNIWVSSKLAMQLANQLELISEEADHQVFRRCSGERTELGTVLSPQARCIRLTDDICPFLEQIDGETTFCSIYSTRPSICRCFPFSYSILFSSKLVLILPAINSSGEILCNGFVLSDTETNNKTAYYCAAELLDEIVDDIKIALEITDLGDRLRNPGNYSI